MESKDEVKYGSNLFCSVVSVGFIFWETWFPLPTIIIRRYSKVVVVNVVVVVVIVVVVIVVIAILRITKTVLFSFLLMEKTNLAEKILRGLEPGTSFYCVFLFQRGSWLWQLILWVEPSFLAVVSSSRSLRTSHLTSQQSMVSVDSN